MTFLRQHYDMGATYSAQGAPGMRPPGGDEATSSELLDLLGRRPEWHQQAACRAEGAANLNLFFPERGGNTKRPKQLCQTCPVRTECETAGAEEQHGIWGLTNVHTRRRNRTSPNQHRRLTVEQLQTARRLWREGASIVELADRYGLQRSNMRRALIGDTYSDVPDPIDPAEIDRGRENRRTLTVEQVVEIREGHKAGVSFSELARCHGTTVRNVRMIVAGQTWRNVE